MSAKKNLLLLFAMVQLLSFNTLARESGQLVAIDRNTPIYTSAKAGEPLFLAVKALQRDMGRILGAPVKIRSLSEMNRPGILIINSTRDQLMPPLTGWESHRVYTSSYDSKKQVVLQGSDLRGTIYAIYTFSEKILGVPPLWYFSSWQPETKNSIIIPPAMDLNIEEPSVKYRAWFPNDTDLFDPWRKSDSMNNAMWLEAALRLKLNTIEWFDNERNYGQPYGVSPTTKLISNYGLLNTTHHHSPLNASFKGWDDYWRITRDTIPPPLLLSNTKYLLEFWRYNVECIVKNKIPMLWVIGFRGNGDHPFWYTFKDAPASMKQRGEIINTMMQQQREIVKQVARDTALEFRTIFYDELSDLLARGFIEPPADTNFIWTYVAARRDHYPNEDVQQLDKNKNYRLGYYFNYQFTSTGSHLAAGEGPWKMEKNYRFIAGKTNRPLAFSVVNAGNLREFLMELSANAVMMWDMKSFSSDAFLLKYSEQYFGRKQAREVAKLYKTYYDAYWQQRKPDLEGFDRQYIFQDLRYKRAIAELAENFLKLPRNQNPLTDIAAEQLKGRTYRLIPQDNHASDQVSAIIYGTTASAKKFLQVKNKAEAMVLKIPVAQRTFFKDNLLQPANYMYYLNESLLQLANGYQESNQQQKKRYVTKARKALQQAQQALQSTATGNFRDWYQGDRVFGFKEVFKLLDRISAK